MVVNSGPAESADANMVAVVHASPQFCPRCTSLPWPSTQEDWYLSQELPLHESFDSLQESAIQGCAFCRFVWLSIVNNCEVTTEVLKMLTKGLIKVSVRLKLFIGDTILVLTPEMGQEGKTFLSSAGTICKPVESSEIELLRDIKSRHIKGTLAKCPGSYPMLR